jgi:hypothetical protein
MVAVLVYNQEDEDPGHDDDHRESLPGDSASSITPQEEDGRGRNRDNCDQRKIIHARDAHRRIESWRRNQQREEQEQRDERDYGYYGPYYDQPCQDRSPEAGHIPAGVKAYSLDF